MGNFFIGICNGIISTFGGLLSMIHSVLPKSPFRIQFDFINKYLGWLNYLLPISEVIIILESWCACILIWYVWQIILRWIKAIE